MYKQISIVRLVRHARKIQETILNKFFQLKINSILPNLCGIHKVLY